MKAQRKFTVLIEHDEDGFHVATVPSLAGCHTQAKTLDTLMKRTREAIELCLESDAAESESAIIPLTRIRVVAGSRVREEVATLIEERAREI